MSGSFECGQLCPHARGMYTMVRVSCERSRLRTGRGEGVDEGVSEGSGLWFTRELRVLIS